MYIGSLNRSIMLQRFTRTSDPDSGEQVETLDQQWTLPAARMSLKGDERTLVASGEAAPLTVGSEAYKYRIRYLPGVDERFRIVDENKVFNVRWVSESPERRVYLDIVAERVS